MRAYGLQGPIRDSVRKNRRHRECGVCHSFRVNKTSARMRARKMLMQRLNAFSRK